jgi:hypothetical protein
MRVPRPLLPVVLASLAACAPAREEAAAPAPSTPPAPWVVDPAGIGPVRTGVTLRQLSAVLGEEVRAAYDVFEACDHVQPVALPRGVALMVLADTVARVDVDSAGVRTAEGVQVGDPQARVLAAYRGRVRDEPHHYDGPEWRYLIVEPAGDTLHRIVFETDGRRVTSYRAGRRPAVDYVEGCA